MPLEAGDGFISGLVSTNPVNATDQVAQGDDHIRLIKTALLGTFPNVTGAVTPTHVELNILDGVTLTASQINDAARLGATNAFTGANSFAAATLFGSGTARGSGGDVTVSKTSASVYLEDTAAASDEKIWRVVNVTGAFELHARTDANGSGTIPVRITRTGTAQVSMILTTGEAEINVTTLDINATGLELAGTLTTPNASASEVGFKGTPQNAQNGDYTLVLSDCGKTIYKASGGAGETITIPANASVAFPVGSIVRIVNNGGGTLTVAITSDTLTLAGAGTTGSRTLSDDGVAVIEKVATTEWFISGAGVT